MNKRKLFKIAVDYDMKANAVSVEVGTTRLFEDMTRDFGVDKEVDEKLREIARECNELINFINEGGDKNEK